jgi:RND family efflux transporter MFP subunit
VGVDDRSSKLDSLRIERSAEPRRSNMLMWLLAGGAVAVVIAVAAWFLLSPAETPAQANTPTVAVTTAPPPSNSVLDAAGYIVARRQATVSSKITGRLIEVLVEEGQRVEAGQIVARLDPTNAAGALQQARARVAQAEANLQSARVALEDEQPSFNRNEEQFKRGIISAQDMEAARTSYNTKRMAVLVQEQTVGVERAAMAVAQQNLDDTIVRAPFSGVVTVKAAEPGEMVSPAASGGFTRTGICTIVDMDSLEVEVDVSESFIGRVRPGLPATVRLNAYPDWEIPAEALTVVPTADRAKATVRVRVVLKAKDPRIVPEMGARVSFLDEDEKGQTP